MTDHDLTALRTWADAHAFGSLQAQQVIALIGERDALLAGLAQSQRESQ